MVNYIIILLIVGTWNLEAMMSWQGWFNQKLKVSTCNTVVEQAYVGKGLFGVVILTTILAFK